MGERRNQQRAIKNQTINITSNLSARSRRRGGFPSPLAGQERDTVLNEYGAYWVPWWASRGAHGWREEH